MGIADGHLAGERAEQIDGGAGLRGGAHRGALKAAAVELIVVDALVLLHFDERLEPGIELVADPQNAGVLIEIAVAVAGDFAVGEDGMS